jgi:hypothetical protein
VQVGDRVGGAALTARRVAIMFQGAPAHTEFFRVSAG